MIYVCVPTAMGIVATPTGATELLLGLVLLLHSLYHHWYNTQYPYQYLATRHAIVLMISSLLYPDIQHVTILALSVYTSVGSLLSAPDDASIS